MTHIENYDEQISRLVDQFKVNEERLKSLLRKTSVDTRRLDLEELARDAQRYLVNIADALDELDAPLGRIDEGNDGISAAMRLRELLDPHNDAHRRLPDAATTIDGRPARVGRHEQGDQNDVELYVGEPRELSIALTPQNARRLAVDLYRVADALDGEYPNRPPR